MTEAIAKAKYIRMSSRKVGLVLELVRGQAVGEARRRLKFCPKRAARPVLKVLDAAAANASTEAQKEEGLVVSQITANPAPTLKRWRAGARGRPRPILKRGCHITVKLKAESGKRKAKSEGRKVKGV